MKTINLSDPKHVYFIGIGGISMSGLAELLLSKGFKVSGSDSKQSELTDSLSEKGAVIFYDQSVSHISDDVDFVVYTAAIRPGNPELDDATNRQLPLLTRAELLGQVMKAYPVPIAISGTHGKTTTTSMVSEILLNAGVDPTISIGGILPSIGGNFRVGNGNHFVTEACEYTNSFLSFFPKISIILNIDADHLDFFKDLDDIRNSFHEFAKLLPADGLLIINGDIPDVSSFVKDLDCQVITVGTGTDNDYYAAGITYDEKACATFTAISKMIPDTGANLYTLDVPGTHNVYNALAAIALADYLGIHHTVTAEALSNFTNSHRRFEYKGVRDGIIIYDDYAHHPTEINATIQTALNVPHNELWIIFQPHTYTRTKALMHDFAKVLSQADHIILPDIYAAREKDNLGISSETLMNHIREYGTDCIYIPSFEEIEKFVLKNCTKNDLLITMGAGDVVNIGESLLE